VRALRWLALIGAAYGAFEMGRWAAYREMEDEPEVRDTSYTVPLAEQREGFGGIA
jgi:hypothetical protein